MSRKPSSGKKTNLSQFGLLDIPSLDDADKPMDLSDDDIDLEAELAAISGGGPKRSRPRKPAPMPASSLDAMIAASLKDVPSDDDVGSGDENDPDLLNELQELAIEDDEAPAPPPRVPRAAPPPPVSGQSSTISLLQDRISNYSLAEKSAKANGESSRARRFGRGLKTLNELLKQAKAGRPINDEDIPPPVSLGKPTDGAQPPQPPPRVAEPPAPIPEPPARELPPTPEVPSAPEEPTAPEEPPCLPEPKNPPPPPPVEELSPERQQGLLIILKRKEEFKAAALASKHAGDKTLALEYLKVVKQFDLVVDAYKAGQEMDLSELPTPEHIAAAATQGRQEEHTQNSNDAETPAAESGGGGLITAATLDEALRQRLAAFQQQEAKAKEEGNSSKARRMGRIVKQYQEAVAAHARGKHVNTEDLPTPAGHGPLPNEGAPQSAASPTPLSPPRPPVPIPTPAVSSTSRYEKQIALLTLRQKQFKEAALDAKKAGDIEQAKEYLRAAKGFDSVIEAAKGGLIVDLKSLPLPPRTKENIEHTFDVISAEDCGPSDDSPTIDLEGDDVILRIQQQLTKQLKLCLDNRDHNKKMGNVAEANRFEHLAVAVKQDLDVVLVAKRLGQDPPKFHYESRQFAVVQCNTDLNENDLELTIVRGIAYNVPNPKEVDTYVKFEFPYPQETPVSDRTVLIKDTNSPEYNAVFPLVINRAARPCLRVFKRHGIKLEVYARGGWFRSDRLLGSVLVKLAPLETAVTIHDSFPLMDGRRPAGGSLEVKLRVRTPLLQQQIENTKHRWLVIDN
ncbi:coiled-coil and C2 domain-containing protein 1-like isoform X2 [Amyelois transitella]|uniref:coiled-coil and C2 domain-containing protein 1-like isoform X2 n=1 Tax=Amyelois transitella TaxID=680683 RepID=UPI00298F930F|nr:coiled-coil and C2 domain-containing protein 1-like isoform X2 [Amyelois transitella]